MSLKWLGRLLLAVALLCCTRPAQAQQPPRKMNVLLIVSDDLNMSLGCYGHPLVKSPHIDRLAARGVRFDRAYTQYPLCNPSRTSLLSGLRPDATKIIDNGTDPRTQLPDAVWLSDLLRRHGYFTARIGKIFHGAFANTATWDVSENGPGKKGKNKNKEKAPAKKDAAAQKEGGIKITWRASERKDEEEPDGATARRIVELLEKNKDRPFFIAAGFHKPHLPFVAPKKYFEHYPPAKIVLPKEPVDVRKGVPPLAFTRTKGDEQMT